MDRNPRPETRQIILSERRIKNSVEKKELEKMKNKKEAEKEEKEGKGEHIHVCLTARRGKKKILDWVTGSYYWNEQGPRQADQAKVLLQLKSVLHC